jgi:hypothetical protein
MRHFVSAMAAVLLISSIPAFAEDAPQASKGAPAPNSSQAQNPSQAQPEEQTADDDDNIQLIIMGKAVQVQVPNPYKNPKPHLLTDAWAMRA